MAPTLPARAGSGRADGGNGVTIGRIGVPLAEQRRKGAGTIPSSAMPYLQELRVRELQEHTPTCAMLSTYPYFTTKKKTYYVGLYLSANLLSTEQ